jgi:hypothetical protein
MAFHIKRKLSIYRVVVNKKLDELNQIFCVLGNSAGIRTTCTGLPDTLNVGGFNAANYWSSSQIDATYASEQSFSTGAQGVTTQKSVELGVRAVRKF